MSMLFKAFVFFNLLNSSLKDILINLNISKSDIKAPKPPITPAIQIFDGFIDINNPTEKGAVKPKANNIPPTKIPKYPRLPKLDIKFETTEFLKRKYAINIIIPKSISLGYLNLDNDTISIIYSFYSIRIYNF